MVTVKRVLDVTGCILDGSLEAMDRPIRWSGPGWYSLGDDGAYHKGQFSTWSRIHIMTADG